MADEITPLGSYEESIYGGPKDAYTDAAHYAHRGDPERDPYHGCYDCRGCGHHKDRHRREKLVVKGYRRLPSRVCTVEGCGCLEWRLGSPTDLLLEEATIRSRCERCSSLTDDPDSPCRACLRDERLRQELHEMHEERQERPTRRSS